MSDGIHSKDLVAFNRALSEYVRYNRRELGPLIESRGRAIRFELYRQFRAIAPDKARIESEAAARGFAIFRRKGKDGKTLTTKQELAARKRSIGWLSLSWLYRQWRSRREGQSGNFPAKSRRGATIGKAIVRTAKGLRSPKVELVSQLEGAARQNVQRSLVSKAMQAQTADMRRYIARKQQERLAHLVRSQLSLS